MTRPKQKPRGNALMVDLFPTHHGGNFGISQAKIVQLIKGFIKHTCIFGEEENIRRSGGAY